MNQVCLRCVSGGGGGRAQYSKGGRQSGPITAGIGVFNAAAGSDCTLEERASVHHRCYIRVTSPLGLWERPEFLNYCCYYYCYYYCYFKKMMPKILNMLIYWLPAVILLSAAVNGEFPQQLLKNSAEIVYLYIFNAKGFFVHVPFFWGGCYPAHVCNLLTVI